MKGREIDLEQRDEYSDPFRDPRIMQGPAGPGSSIRAALSALSSQFSALQVETSRPKLHPPCVLNRLLLEKLRVGQEPKCPFAFSYVAKTFHSGRRPICTMVNSPKRHSYTASPQ
ncbi:unnamed protein product [Fusarium graminearum]|nr:unnamed protein product [Fusarium graminearum]CAG1989016.1 unnamed protein product [Fusarium graminearum]VTO89603.1 unnamed protein product [Fusarium graminearum]